MAEYIERETAVLSLLDKGQHSRRYKLGEIWELDFEEIREAINSIPAADVRPVVRCRECKHWETDWTPQGVSDGRHYCAPLDLFPSADWYCSDGERREES